MPASPWGQPSVPGSAVSCGCEGFRRASGLAAPRSCRKRAVSSSARGKSSSLPLSQPGGDLWELVAVCSSPCQKKAPLAAEEDVKSAGAFARITLNGVRAATVCFPCAEQPCH